jgi:hypothetical protein
VACAAHTAPAPPPGSAEGENLDEILAVVEGKMITRRRLIRETGGRSPDIDDATFESSLHRRLKERVVEEILVREAHRVGIRLKEKHLDEVIREQSRVIVKDASKSEGRPVTIDEVLADRGLTREEFRENTRRRGLCEICLLRMLEGVGGARPQIDMEVSPAEVKRMYALNPDAYKLKRGVKLVLFRFPLRRYTETAPSFEEAEAAAIRDARALAEAFRNGEEADALARRHDLSRDRGEMQAIPRMIEEGDAALEVSVGSGAVAWLFDPKRRPRDAAVQPDPQGPRVYGIVEVQEPREREWDEITAEIVARVQDARRLRVRTELIVRAVTEQNVLWPSSLADELVVDAQGILDEMAQHPILGAAQFR